MTKLRYINNSQPQLQCLLSLLLDYDVVLCPNNIFLSLSVKAKLRQMERQLKYHDDQSKQQEGISNIHTFELDGAWQHLRKNPSQFSKKVMIKYKEQTNKIVSSFRPVNLPPVNIKLVNRYVL